MSTASITATAAPRITLRAARILAALEGTPGAFTRVTWESFPTPAAAHKGVTLHKLSTATVRSGVEYGNLRNVREAIDAGERGPVQPRKWGEWIVRNILLGHKDREYVALYPIAGQRVSTVYSVDGVEVSRERFASYLRPGDARKMGEPIDVFTVNVDGVLSVGSLTLAA